MSSLDINSHIELNNGVKMPLFGLGLYQAPQSEAAQAIEHALAKAGYRMLDGAKIYKNETQIGEGLRASGLRRDQVFIVSKLFTTEGGRQAAIDAIEDSLRQMGVEYIDQYLLHAPQGGRVLESYDVLLDYQARGVLKSIGVSNFGVAHLEAIKNSGRPLPQVNQIELHPWCTYPDIVDWCRRNGVVLVGYSPLARAHKLEDPLVKELANKYQKTPVQILIRWSLQNNFVTIPKSTKPNRIDENANVFDFELDKQDFERLNEIGLHVKEKLGWDPTTNDIPTKFGPTQL